MNEYFTTQFMWSCFFSVFGVHYKRMNEVVQTKKRCVRKSVRMTLNMEELYFSIHWQRRNVSAELR